MSKSGQFAPVYYQVNAFYNRAGKGEFFRDLLSVGLIWYWESARGPDAEIYDNPDLPAIRFLTPVTSDTVATLLADLEERNEEDDGRLVAIFGFDSGMSGLEQGRILDPVKFATWHAQFTEHGSGPIQAILFVLPDSYYETLFFSCEPVECARRLFDLWEVQSKSPSRHDNYGRYVEILISLFGKAGS